MIVIDASALAKFVLREEGSSQVTDYLRAGTVSPPLVMKEVVNAVWKRHRRGETSRQEADIMLKLLKKLVGVSVRMEAQLSYIDQAIEIAFNRNVTVYDSLYIALAKETALDLLTSDEKQALVANTEGVKAVLLA